MPSVIRLGSQGSDVILAQDCLDQRGNGCETDGIFGPGTEARVKEFQRKNHLVADGVVGPKTWSFLLAGKPAEAGYLPTGKEVLERAASLGHQVWSEEGRLWLFGIRSPARNSNSFDDSLGCVWADSRGTNTKYWLGTTDPGSYWLIHPPNPRGAAILVEGQYLDAWTLGTHGGKYEALCQRRGEVRVYRDGSRDLKLDLDPKSITQGYFGINLHAATQVPGGESKQVGKWSAGCQVHATEQGFREMMELAREQVKKTGRKTFSYTLLNKWW